MLASKKRVFRMQEHRMEGQRRPLVSLLTSTLGGAIAWFVYLQVLQFTASALSSTLIEPARVPWIFLQISVTAVAVFAAFSVLAAVLSHLRWWMHWLAFVAGVVACIAMRLPPQGIDLTIEVFFRTALVGAVISSGIAAHLLSLYRDRDGSAKRE
jgi:uncharacterized BrkB/YihY/UPF0761 family membrane protein